MLERLPLAGDEVVLDAGCGSGRVTEALVERLPRGRVVALDASASMLAEARARLGRFGDRVRLVQADLRRPLPLDEAVDAVFSTATFHWVADHDALFAHLAAVLRPGGMLVAQCGGAGNVASVARVVAAMGEPISGSVTFAAPAETRQRLEAAGFVDVEAWLTPEPTPFEREALEAFLATVVLRDHLARRGPAERPAFVREVAARLPRPELDYVRLNITARRAVAGPR